MDDLANRVLHASFNFTSKSASEALRILRSFSVVPVALDVLPAELTAQKQQTSELFRAFATRVQGKFEICEFCINFKKGAVVVHWIMKVKYIKHKKQFMMC